MLKRKFKFILSVLSIVFILVSFVFALPCFADSPGLFSMGGVGTGFIVSPYTNWTVKIDTYDTDVSLDLSYSYFSNSTTSYIFSGVYDNGNENVATLDAYLEYEELYGTGYLTSDYTFYNNYGFQIVGLQFSAKDFYCYNSLDPDNAPLYYSAFDFSDLFGESVEPDILIDCTYSYLGSDEVLRYVGSFTDEHFEVIDPAFYSDISVETQPVYFHSFSFYFDYPTTNYSSFTFWSQLCTDIGDYRALDMDQAPAPLPDASVFADYTSWIGTAVSGFLNFQLFSGFSIGGLLMVLISFSCVIWFLKLFAGG